MTSPKRQKLRLSGGTELSFVTAGDAAKPALLLLHGFPSSARTFDGIIPGLARIVHVIAPDLPGYGQSEPLAKPTFEALGGAIQQLLDHLQIGQRFIYLHDWGAPVGVHIAMQAPERVAGLIIQNANEHRTGFGPLWHDTFEFWRNPTPETEKKATSHLTFDSRASSTRAACPTRSQPGSKANPGWRTGA